MAGEEWNGTDCKKCQIDQYKSSIGNNISCEKCPQNETAPEEGYSNCGKSACLTGSQDPQNTNFSSRDETCLLIYANDVIWLICKLCSKAKIFMQITKTSTKSVKYQARHIPFVQHFESSLFNSSLSCWSVETGWRLHTVWKWDLQEPYW